MRVCGTLAGMRAMAMAIASVVALLLTAPAATGQGSGVVVDSNRPEFWQGRVLQSDPRVRDVPECRQNGCDRVEVGVHLPAGLRVKPGGVELAVRTVGASPDDSVGFAVYQ